MDQYDLVVVGTGEGGSRVTDRCAKAGWRVAVVDDEPYGSSYMEPSNFFDRLFGRTDSGG